MTFYAGQNGLAIAMALLATHVGWTSVVKEERSRVLRWGNGHVFGPLTHTVATHTNEVATVPGIRSTLNQGEETTMKPNAITVLLEACALCLSIGTLSYAQEVKGPTQFDLAILDEHNVSFVVPSAIIVDERGKVGGVTFTVTNHTKKEQGFTIDKLHVKEVLKPGETKTIKLSVTELDGIGTDQSVFPYYSHVDPKHIGGLLYLKR